MDELVEAFLLESRENLEQLDHDLLLLEEHPAAPEPVASAFRSLHTIKGTCAFFGFPRLETLSHAAENLLGSLRDGETRATPDIVTLLLEVSDRLGGIISAIESDGAEPDEPNTALEDRLGAVLAFAVGSEPEPVAEPSEGTDADEPEPEPEPESVADAAPVPPAGPVGPAGGTAASGTLRVGVGLLDDFMSLVGELVLARNQMHQHGEASLGPLAPVAERIDQITVGLQETATKARMQPVRQVFAKLPRAARDVGYTTGKDIQLLTEGEETELDRTVLDAIRDPLTHLVRNAVDHGIESPDARQKAGKPRQGTVRVRAAQSGDQVAIEVVDDGGGIDPQRVLDKALDRGLIRADQAEAMGHREALELVFAPGFSTAAAVTNVSGRGVGMDVVRTNVEAIGGSVELESQQGVGSTVRITLPLTLAIIPALVVRCGGQEFALPQASLLELLRLGGPSAHRLEAMHTATVIRHRDRLLPVVALADLLGLEPASAADMGTLVLLTSDGGSFGVVVDEVLETVEIVVKPLHPQIRDLGWYSGTTILGDGNVILILDVAALARACGPFEEATAGLAASEPGAVAGPQDRTYLVAEHRGEVLAMPVDAIDRIEEVAAERVEWVGGVPVLQSRDELVHLHGHLDQLGVDPATRFVAVVFQGSEPRSAVCLPSVERIAPGALHEDEGLVISEGRAARLVATAQVAGGGPS